MANALYDYPRELAATVGLAWTTDAFTAYLLDAGAYSFDATDQFLDSVAAPARIAGPVTLAGKSAAGGSCDCSDITFVAVTGVSVESLLIVQDTGVEATSPNVAYIDQGTNLPITPNGGDIAVTIDSGVNKLFRL